MATPLLTALRDAWPNAHITWIVEHKEAPAIDAHPYLDELLFWDSSYWKRMLKRGLLPVWWLQGKKLRRQLRDRQFDIFISFQPEEWGYLLAQACGAEIRIGVFDTLRQLNKATETSKNTRLYTRAFTFDSLPIHRTDQYLLPLTALGLGEPSEKRMVMGYTTIDDGTVDQKLQDKGLTGKEFVVIAPMTQWASRNWPGGNYAHLIDGLREKNVPAVLVGGVKERGAIGEIAEKLRYPALQLVGDLNFRELAALIAKAALVISGDTAPMHVAAAVGTPYLALFGPTPAPVLAPLSGNGKLLLKPVPCGPCYQPQCQFSDETRYQTCLRQISVPEVLEAACELLARGKKSSLSSRFDPFAPGEDA